MKSDVAAKRYVVCGSRPWSRRIYNEVIEKYPGKWYFVGSRDELALDFLREIDPRYVFLLHWSWMVPPEIFQSYECVCFHMTDLPFGRGGSPLQNLVLRGYRSTKLTAFRVTGECDAGPVYMKRRLSLEGNAEEIYIRATYLAARMIRQIITREPQPCPQKGKAVLFARRKPKESEIPALPSLWSLFDFIRMLDAEGYPKAYLVYKGFRYEFRRAALYDGKIVADVTITPAGEDQ